MTLRSVGAGQRLADLHRHEQIELDSHASAGHTTRRSPNASLLRSMIAAPTVPDRDRARLDLPAGLRPSQIWAARTYGPQVSISLAKSSCMSL